MQRCACDRRPVNWYAHPHTTYRRSAAHRNRHPDRSTLPTRSPGQTRTSTRRKPPKYTAKKCFIGSNTKTPRPPHRVDRPVALRPVRSSAIPQTVAMHTLLRSGQRGIRGTVTGCGCPTRSPACALTSAGNPRNPHHPRPPSDPQAHRAERGSSTRPSIHPDSGRLRIPIRSNRSRHPNQTWATGHQRHARRSRCARNQPLTRQERYSCLSRAPVRLPNTLCPHSNLTECRTAAKIIFSTRLQLSKQPSYSRALSHITPDSPHITTANASGRVEGWPRVSRRGGAISSFLYLESTGEKRRRLWE